MRILFISRAYPPVTGGIENQNYELSVWLQKFSHTKTIANRYGKKFLPIFFPYIILRTLIIAHRYDIILLGDGVLALVGFIIKKFFPRKTVISIVHGLDLTYKNSFYQKWWVSSFLPSLDGLIAVSKETHALALERNIPDTKIVVIPNGVDVESVSKEYTRADLATLLGKDISETTVLLTAGRLAKRKGVEWFIRNVIPILPASILYVVSGDGIERENIECAIRETQSEGRVLLLGRVSDTDRNILLNTVDIFVQPNIHIDGDMEGFGIAVIEATACGRPVVASNIEGLKDAIAHNENGILVESGHAEAFQNVLIDLIDHPEKRQDIGMRARQYTKTHYHWNIIARSYVKALEQFICK
ncbi:MAG: glycosyltransferase family 4 protein [Candidatus Moranbacteria bacterium]|nr:glycosyltransferase family 4 protein [Candidatus Moranbacteria bacterium]MDD3965120.1 glycosyltransferase family 4 protein [Candidatus Moranbacteria bacterium]